MRAKTSMIFVALLLTLPSLAGAALTDELTIGGATYNLTFYPEKNLAPAESPSFCVTFTQDGSVLGYAQSGEYSDPTGILVGSWYENGDDIILSSSEADGFTDTIPMIGVLLSGSSKFGGRWFDYFPSSTNAAIFEGGTFFASKVASCPTGEEKLPHPKTGKVMSAD